MGSKRLDQEAATLLGEPVLAGTVVRSRLSTKDTILDLAGLVPAVGNVIQTVGQAISLPQVETKKPVTFKRLSVGLPSTMYLTVSTTRLSLHSVKGIFRRSLVKTVFTIPRSSLVGITMKFNWMTLLASMWKIDNRQNNIAILIAPGASPQIEGGYLHLDEAAVLELATADRKGIKKMQSLSRESALPPVLSASLLEQPNATS